MSLKNIFHIYTLLICFIAVLILIISTALSFNALTNLFVPEYKFSSSLRHYKSNEEFINFNKNKLNEDKAKVEFLSQLSPAQLEEKRVYERQEFLEEQKSMAIADLILFFCWILVALIFFYIHWRLYKKTKEAL